MNIAHVCAQAGLEVLMNPETGLPPLPGAQIGIVLPARLPEDAVKDEKSTRR